MDEIRLHILVTSGVIDTHDLHVWTISSGMPVLSVHVTVDNAVLADAAGGQVLHRPRVVSGSTSTSNTAVPLEPAGHAEHEPATHS